MTLKDKIALIEKYDSTIIKPTERGYIVSIFEGEVDIELNTKRELEDWVNYQLAADPAYYGLNVGAFVEVATHPTGIYLLDGTTGEGVHPNSFEDVLYIHSRPIEAIEKDGENTAVYVSL